MPGVRADARDRQPGAPPGILIRHFGRRDVEPVVQAVAGYLNAVGIKCNIIAQQYQITTTNVKAHKNYGLTFFGMSGGADPGPNFRASLKT